MMATGRWADAVAVPVVRWLTRHLLAPLAARARSRARPPPRGGVRAADAKRPPPKPGRKTRPGAEGGGNAGGENSTEGARRRAITAGCTAPASGHPTRAREHRPPARQASGTCRTGPFEGRRRGRVFLNSWLKLRSRTSPRISSGTARRETRPTQEQMPENFTRVQRSAIMARVKSVNTGAERTVRRQLRTLGVRFKGQRRDLPGCPDFALPEIRVAIFVHGCFWHQHSCKRGNRRPASNVAYWTTKLARNVARDRVSRRNLRRLGWHVITIWECQLKRASLQARIAKCFSEPSPRS